MTFIATKLFHKAGEGSGGGGGGDQHNLGWYATQSALETAHPTANNGDWAIVGSTDTVWVWDTDTSAWVDSDQKGQVTSVNNQTGAVTLTASDVGALPDNTHIPADPVQADWDEADSAALDYIKNKPTIPAAQVNSDWNANSGVAQILNKPTIPDAIQTGTMPTASADELGKVYQFIGTTDANYTHGYFYECVSDGQNPATYSWSNVQVQASSGGGSGLPDQTGKGGRFLATDGTDASWSDNIQITGSSGSYGIVSIGVGASVPQSTAFGGIAIGQSTSVTGKHGISIGTSATASTGISIGKGADSSGNGISIGGGDAPNGGIHIGMFGINSTQSTMTVSLGTTGINYHMYTLLDSNGTIPTARLTKVNSTITLTAAGWSSNTQTVTVNGVTSTSVVFVAPDPADTTDYVSAGILCTAQGSNSLTFTATTTPSADIDVVVVAM